MYKDIEDIIEFRQFDAVSQSERVEEIVTTLLDQRTENHFSSWPWIEIWMRNLPPDCRVSLVAGFIDNRPVIAFFLGHRTIKRRKFFKIRQLGLNISLNDGLDPTYLNYNKILIDPEIKISLESILNRLPNDKWDEFYIREYGSTYNPNVILNSALYSKYDLLVDKKKSRYVNLDKIRGNGNDYLAMLSQNRRSQIRRSIREYSKYGEIHIHTAGNVQEALDILEELIELHQSEWNKRGYPGVFSNQYCAQFHKNFIRERFEHGEILLLRTSAGDQTIGCLYLIVHDEYVHYYISGFNYPPGNLFRPGFICHYLAILQCAEAGFRIYDFLEGPETYKKSLSTDYIEMQDIIVRKKSLKYRIEGILVRCFTYYKRLINSFYRDRRRL